MTKIAWTDKTWNPVTGCTRVSKGCDNCYAVTMTRRLAGMGQEKYQGLMGKGHFSGVVKCHDDALEIPLRWRKPCRVFVNSMSDMFHDEIPGGFIDEVFCTMAMCPTHTFQILTKRPRQMSEYLAEPIEATWFYKVLRRCSDRKPGLMVNDTAHTWIVPGSRWCLPNVWLGTSVEDQAAADERIPWLQECPAAIRFLSVEPMLGPITFPSLDGIHWVIFGCESGPKRRPFVTHWLQDGIKQCDAAGVPVFVKQINIERNGRFVVSKDSREWRDEFQRQEWPHPMTLSE